MLSSVEKKPMPNEIAIVMEYPRLGSAVSTLLEDGKPCLELLTFSHRHCSILTTPSPWITSCSEGH